MKKIFLIHTAIIFSISIISIKSHSQETFTGYLSKETFFGKIHEVRNQYGINKTIPKEMEYKIIIRYAGNTGQINNEYFKKSKNQKRTSWILLGGGAAMFTGGAITMQHSNSKGGNEVPFILGGMAMAVSSAPFFISSAVNKHKARLELRKQAMLTMSATDNKNIYQTSVSLKIGL